MPESLRQPSILPVRQQRFGMGCSVAFRGLSFRVRMPRLIVRFLMQRISVVQLACQTHRGQQSRTNPVQMPALKVNSRLIFESQGFLRGSSFYCGLPFASSCCAPWSFSALVPERLDLGEPRPSFLGPLICFESIHNSKSKYMVYGISGATVAAICVCGCPAIRILKSRRLFPEGPITIANPRSERKE